MPAPPRHHTREEAHEGHHEVARQHLPQLIQRRVRELSHEDEDQGRAAAPLDVPDGENLSVVLVDKGGREIQAQDQVRGLGACACAGRAKCMCKHVNR